ncbi:ABC transporter permease [Halopenitus malekzadehii]|uniref:ABC transporter permease n=1 Tax=Halopenitus malekzadehii TaxID=1267564 RepID=UPI000B8923F6|nr:ABC transporter permease subunit [Halopenitus malekzadehii]
MIDRSSARRLAAQVGHVARHEFLWLRRGWTVPTVAVLFVLSIVSVVRQADPPGAGGQPLTVLALVPNGDPLSSTAVVLFTLGRVLTLLLPLVVVVLTAGTLAGDTQAGRLRTLQTFPVSRYAVVGGKLLARSAVVGSVVVLGLIAGALTSWFQFGVTDPVSYSLFLLVSVGFALSLTGTTVAVSTLVAARSQAIALSLGPFLVFAFLGVDPGVPSVLRTGFLVQPYQLLVAGTHNQLVAIPRVMATARPQAPLGGLVLSDGVSFCALFAWPITLIILAVGRYCQRDL